MDKVSEKFAKLGVENAPGQESMQKSAELPLTGGPLKGRPVDFSHGDVDAHPPIPGSLERFVSGYEKERGRQAYTEYRGKCDIREYLADKLARFSGAPVDAATEIILTPGTQGALFLAVGALVGAGDGVAIIEPDYFANRKLVEFFDGILTTVPIRWREREKYSGLDLEALERAFQSGVKLFLYSNPNNPTGVLYSPEEVSAIGKLARKYGVAVIADELYSRQILNGALTYTHLRALDERPETLVTIIGPSKTESLSGFRLGAAYGSAPVIARMEKLQAIVSLRAAGYCQAALRGWFSEPDGWLESRIADHREIRDELLAVISRHSGFWARPTEGGSYLFVKLPELSVTLKQFVRICREQGSVTVTPGTEFGPAFTDFIRLNFSQDRAAAVEAMERVCLLGERYARRTAE